MGPSWIYFCMAVEESAVFVTRFLTFKQMSVSVEAYENEKKVGATGFRHFEALVVGMLFRAWIGHYSAEDSWIRRETYQTALNAIKPHVDNKTLKLVHKFVSFQLQLPNQTLRNVRETGPHSHMCLFVRSPSLNRTRGT
jgi:hypothetical protein